jgi:hypothetical protein
MHLLLLDLARERFAGEKALFWLMRGAFVLGWRLADMENLMLKMHHDPDFVHGAARTTTAFNLEMLDLLAEAGLDVLGVEDDIADTKSSLIPPQQFREFVNHYDRQLVESNLESQCESPIDVVGLQRRFHLVVEGVRDFHVDVGIAVLDEESDQGGQHGRHAHARIEPDVESDLGATGRVDRQNRDEQARSDGPIGLEPPAVESVSREERNPKHHERRDREHVKSHQTARGDADCLVDIGLEVRDIARQCTVPPGG